MRSVRSNVAWRLIIVSTALTILALPLVGYAQEAIVSGAITDSTGGVLPGVAVKAENEASGNTFETVTDGRGAYSMPVRIGVYKITAALQGFNPVTRSVEVLVGQTAVINLQMTPAGVSESLTVSGQAPLIEVSTSEGR